MTCLSVRTTPTETAEKVAIALARTSEGAITVLTGYEAANIRGRISKTAVRFLETKGQLPETEIVWVPGHTFPAGNQAAHAAARAHVHRAIIYEGRTPPAAPKTEPLVKYGAILAHFHQSRRIFPAPHPELSRQEANRLRRIYSSEPVGFKEFNGIPLNSYPHRTLLHAIYPTLYSATRNFCPLTGTL